LEVRGAKDKMNFTFIHKRASYENETVESDHDIVDVVLQNEFIEIKI